MWLFIIWLLPAMLSTGIGLYTDNWGIGLGLAFVWIGFCIFQGSMIIGQLEFVVIERLGKYQTVYFRGWHVRVIGVDRIRVAGNLLAKRLQLYADEHALKMDFRDSSAAIDASIWYQIGDPEDISKGNLKNIVQAIKVWVYMYEKPEERIYNLIDGTLRPKLQQKSIEEASGNLDFIADEVIKEVAGEMKKLGAYVPSGRKCLIIEDIQLPEEVVQLNEIVLEAQKHAEGNKKEAAGYWGPIKEISDNLGVDIREARSIYENQRSLDKLEKIRPALIIGKDIGAILGSLNLSNAK